jgi:hypothetical protein
MERGCLPAQDVLERRAPVWCRVWLSSYWPTAAPTHHSSLDSGGSHAQSSSCIRPEHRGAGHLAALMAERGGSVRERERERGRG